MNKPLTNEEVCRRLQDKFHGTITPLEDYPGSRKHWPMQCQCGYKWQPEARSLFSGFGCPKCAVRKNALQRQLTHQQAEAQILNNFQGRITPLEPYPGKATYGRWAVQCQCGYKWKPFITSLFAGGGCPKCAHRQTSIRQRLTNQEAIKKLLEISKGKIVPLEPYAKQTKRWAVQCQCGHSWKPFASNLFCGSGCPKCAEYGFQPDRPGILYYLRVTSGLGVFYKIGITNKTVQERYRIEKTPFEIIEIWPFKIGADARIREMEILAAHKASRYFGPRVMTMADNKEIFICDVLGLDKPGQRELLAA